MKKEFMKPFVWGAVVGAIVLLIVIFATGWVVTNNTAKNRAVQVAEKAVINHLAPICVDQFLKDPNNEKLIQELEQTDSWKRRNFIEKGGWATMPGSESFAQGVADECAKRLLEQSIK